jgi:hypothetical protein
MKPVIPVLLILVAIAAAVSAAWLFLSRSYPSARGDVFAEQRALPPFSRIVIDGFVEVTLVQGGTETVTIEAPSKQLASVRTDVSDGTLTIANNQSRRWWSEFLGGAVRPARVTVTYREIEAISAAGAVKIRADRLKTDRLKVSASGATSLKISDLDTKELSVSGSGAMKVEIVGRATAQSIAISGAGDYRAAELVSDDARVTVSGAGRVVVQAEKTLRIGLSGAGSVEYIGNPKVTQQISGAGRVKRRDAAEAVHAIA